MSTQPSRITLMKTENTGSNGGVVQCEARELIHIPLALLSPLAETPPASIRTSPEANNNTKYSYVATAETDYGLRRVIRT
jgi:hypothetical protein